MVTFNVGGVLGRHVILFYDANSRTIDSLSFQVDAKTTIRDGGYYKSMFDLFYIGMFADVKEGTFPILWNGSFHNSIRTNGTHQTRCNDSYQIR